MGVARDKPDILDMGGEKETTVWQAVLGMSWFGLNVLDWQPLDLDLHKQEQMARQTVR